MGNQHRVVCASGEEDDGTLLGAAVTSRMQVVHTWFVHFVRTFRVVSFVTSRTRFSGGVVADVHPARAFFDVSKWKHRAQGR